MIPIQRTAPVTTAISPGASGALHSRAMWVAAFAIGVVVVATLLLLPGDDLPETNVWDKLEHASVFAGLIVLGAVAKPQWSWRITLTAGLIAFGSLCELLQCFVPGREASFQDAAANATGVAFGLVVIVAMEWCIRWLLAKQLAGRGFPSYDSAST